MGPGPPDHSSGVRGLKGTVHMAEVMTKLYKGDCLALLPNVPDESIDLILCDLPYGTTRNPWDTVIDPTELWKQYRRIIKPHGCIALFSQLPFTLDIIAPARNLFRYEWVWKKNMGTGFLNANRMPIRTHENILIFYKHMPKYNPQKMPGKPYTRTLTDKHTTTYCTYSPTATVNKTGLRYPLDVIAFSNAYNGTPEHTHPTQKPVDLCEYLIKTYTDAGDIVLDNAMGSGSIWVAARHIGRRFIGIEKDKSYYEIAAKRIKEADQTCY